MSILKKDPVLCVFNCIRFAIPFICKCRTLPEHTAGGRFVKTVHVFEACKLGLGKTLSIDELLTADGLQCKTRTRRHAIHLAESGQRKALGHYCMHYTNMTHLVSSTCSIVLPLYTNPFRQINLQPRHSRPFWF